MALKYIEVSGKTEDEAIENALRQLGLSRESVSVELLERAKPGFLGIGARPARIRVAYGLEDEEPAPAAKKPASEPKKKPAPQAKKETAPAGERADVPAKEKPPRRSQPGRREDRADAPAAEEDMPPVEPEDLGEPCHDEKAQKIEEFLTGLLEHMGSEAQVKVYLPEEGRYKVLLEGEKLGSLIGRRGETLDAIQQLTGYAVNRGSDKRVRIQVDAENYRLKREQSLKHLALKVAAKVTKYHRNVTMEPMNAYERHVIHTALQDVENITTYSMGAEPNRRVIVAYDKDKGKENKESK